MMMMTDDVATYVHQHIPYDDLPDSVRSTIAQTTYLSRVLESCLLSSLPHTELPADIRGSITHKHYMKLVLERSYELRRVYPYRFISDMICDHHTTPYEYYIRILEATLKSEKSYDTLPNFTALDIVRLLGIGRNQYIDLLNTLRAKKKDGWKALLSTATSSSSTPRALLPQRIQCAFTPTTQGVAHTAVIQPWMCVFPVSCVPAEVLQSTLTAEELSLYTLISRRASLCEQNHNFLSGEKKWRPYIACELPRKMLHTLFVHSCVYLDFALQDEDRIDVPTIQDFVMNRTTSDPTEKRLYDILMAVDERTSLQVLSMLLAFDVHDVKAMVAVYIRLGLARRCNAMKSILERAGELAVTIHDSWLEAVEATVMAETDPSASPTTQYTQKYSKRLGVMFDATLAAYLMMGTLGGAVKEHAVTMFETGKLTHNNLSSFLPQLEEARRNTPAILMEGETRKYFEAAFCLHDLVVTLRERGFVVDLLKLEALEALEPGTRFQMLHRAYSSVLCVCPLQAITFSSSVPQMFGPVNPIMCTPWTALWLHHKIGRGPRSCVYGRGTRVRCLPQSFFASLEAVHVVPWTEPGKVQRQIVAGSVLCSLNNTLRACPVWMYDVTPPTPGHVMTTLQVPFAVRGDCALLRANVVRAFGRTKLHGHNVVSDADVSTVVELVTVCTEALHATDSIGYFTIMVAMMNSGLDPLLSDVVGGTSNCFVVRADFGLSLESQSLLCDQLSTVPFLQQPSCGDDDIAVENKAHEQNMKMLEDELTAFIENQDYLNCTPPPSNKGGDMLLSSPPRTFTTERVALEETLSRAAAPDTITVPLEASTRMYYPPSLVFDGTCLRMMSL